MNDLQLQFISESRELLEEIGAALLRFERMPSDADNLGNLFRLVHTLKGNCGLFDDLAPLGVVLHAAEDTLDKVRAGQSTLGLQETDLLMEVMDFVVAGVDAWEAQRYQPAEQLDHARLLAQRIVSARAASAVDVVMDVLPPTPAEVQIEPWQTDVISTLPADAARRVCVTYRPESQCFFKGEDPLNLALGVPELDYLEVLPAGHWESPATFDFYQCQLEIRLVSKASLQQVQQVFEYVPEQVVLTEVSSTHSATEPEAGHSAVKPLEPSLRSKLARLWQVQCTVMSMLAPNDKAWQGRANGVVAAVCALAEAAARPAWAQAAREMLEVCLENEDPRPLQAWLQNRPAELEEAIANQPVAAVAAAAKAAPASQAGGPIAPAAAASGAAPAAEAESRGISVLKVPREKIDRLMELIGEMVVAKNALPYMADRAQNEFACRELAREIKANHSVINRIAEEMQDAIMQVRMLPVSVVFQRFPRLVRDLSRKLGKQVRLEITGEDTEADKNMIESLSEPLIHLLRNSLDHGIETPEVRTDAGKPAEGLIAIHAWQDSDRVHISIRDDGAGMDPARLKKKALEKGLLPAEKLDAMSEKDLLQLIFLPGFSTAAQVSDVSGRGVGMDVVRSAIARVNGQVDLQSSLGMGTTLTLSLPLSMAVNKVMIIEVAGQQFGLPMEVVVETVRVPRSSLHCIQNQQATVLRGKIIPLVQLHDLLGLDEKPQTNDQDELAVLVTRVAHETVGVVVDDFDSTIDILLRPLDGVLANMHQYAGSALLGDGTVLLILNLMEMMSCQ